MSVNLSDRQQIADLMTGWMYRDLEQWDSLRSLFHPDGTIEITWFEGRFSDFVDGSMRMGASDLRTKHVIASPVVTFNRDKAIAETNAIIVCENVKLGLGCEGHSRFNDCVEKRDGVWRIAHRACIYDMGKFTFPRGFVEIDVTAVDRHPREFAPLAYVLEKSGFPVTRQIPTKGSEQENEIKASARRWLQVDGN